MVKKCYIEAKASLGKVDFDVSGLPKKVGIVATVQYLSDMNKIVDYLWKKGIKAVIAGQVLGCDAGAAVRHKDDVEAFVYVGTGQFHPIGVSLQTGKKVFVLHPDSMQLTELSTQDVEKIKKKKKGMLAKFYSSNVIGVLMTTKGGQSTVQGGDVKVLEVEKKHPDKKFYHFICDTLNYSELENFGFVQCWVNTMCPRMTEDVKLLNIEDLT